jgi:predicted  nucleic acid-binding Zn-ribbon protein
MLWICTGCGTAYSVGASVCPHCGAQEFRLSTDPEDGLVYVAGPDGEPAPAPAPEKPAPAGGEKAK